MNRLPVLPTAVLLASTIAGQAEPRSGLEALRDSKLAADFLKKADWVTDYDQARARAAKQGKLIFAYFTRSYSP